MLLAKSYFAHRCGFEQAPAIVNIKAHVVPQAANLALWAAAPAGAAHVQSVAHSNQSCGCSSWRHEPL